MDQAVILARGLGKRMRAGSGAALTAEQQRAAASGVKAMVPIGRPFLDYVLTALADAGYHRVGLVIGPEHDAVRRYYTRDVRPTRLTVDFAVQAEARGTADAVAAAEPLVGDDPILVINSDNYYPPEALAALRRLEGPGLAAFSRHAMIERSNVAAERITRFAVVEADDAGVLRRIHEKPDADLIAALPEPVGVSMNCWRFDARIFEACRRIKPSSRGEYEITDAVQYSIDHLGVAYRVVMFDEPVLDLSSRDDVAGVATRLKGQEVRL